MSVFEYTALDPEGNTRKGVIESDGVRQASQLLRDKQWVPLKLKAASVRRLGLSTDRNLKISRQQLVLITRQLATLIASGMPVDASIRAAAEQNTEKSTVKLLLEMRARILEGHSLAHAMKEYSRIFPVLYSSTVAAGEKSGYLGPILERLADYIESSFESRQKIMLALLYPVILFVFSALIVMGLLSYVVPKIVVVFTNTGQTLPVLTRGLIAISDFLASYGLLVALVLAALLAMCKLILQHREFHEQFERLKLRVPVFGRLIAGLDTARFISTLSILSSSGIKLVEGMRIANETVENSHIKIRIKQAIKMVEEGASLRAGLTRAECFQPLMVHMIGSGEASGALDEMLRRAADNQRITMENQVALMVRLFEPFMLVVMGCVVMLIVLAILLPILNLNRLVL